MLKKLLKIFKWVAGILIALFLTITLLILVYEEDIKQYAVSKLNDHLKVPVKVEKIDLVFWSTFPYASLEFKNVSINDAFPNEISNDTLFSAKYIYFKFSLLDLWNDEYKVKETLVENGKLHLKVNEQGGINYDILKPSGNKEKSQFDFELENFKLNNFELSYKDYELKQFYDFNTVSTSLNGAFSEEKYDMNMHGDYLIHRVQKGEVPFISDQESKIKLVLEVNQKESFYTIKDGTIDLGDMSFLAEGFFSGDSISLDIKGNEIGIEDFVSTFQDKTISQAREYNGKGALKFDLGIRYDSTMKLADVHAEFEVKEGHLSLDNQKVEMNGLSFIGSYSNFSGNKDDQLIIKELSGNSMNGGFVGQFQLKNTEAPIISTQFDGSFDLNVLHQLFFPQLAESLSGTIASEMDIKVHWGENGELVFDKLFGNLHFNNVSAQLDQLPRKLEELTGDFSLKNNMLRFKGLSLKYAESDIEGFGSIQNLLAQSQNNAPSVVVKSNIKANKIKVEDFYFEEESSVYESTPEHIFPQNLKLKANADVKVVEADGHEYENVKTDLTMSGKELYLYSLSFNHCKGFIRGNVKIKEHANKPFDVIAHLGLKGVNIKSLFKEWNNFGQSTLKSENISGDLNSRVNLYIPVSRKGKAVYDQLEADINVTLNRGEINNLESFKSITDYMRSQKAVNLLMKKHIDYFEKELTHIQFEQLTNEIHIGNEKILIPEMTIASSALNLNISGTHTFNNHLDYDLDFRFRELKIDDSDTEFGVVEDDGTGIRIFMKMYGHIDDLHFSMDKASKKENRKEKIEEEKRTVKSMLKEDFGLYKKDSTIQEFEKEKDPEPDFEYYDGVFKDTTAEDTREKKKKKGFFKKFIEKSKKEKEKNEEKEVEIDM